ncbi:hypothetical protein OsI_02645 [Oryza sativa Indica Group]|uniref:DUF6598 domain-containing protein n=1 Tax=Oryza sativa subsp. indica TaxID=39946 RepID=A2WS06_ORYSI|nr:hypothetical protein OsI_02645 [Oryza sativa Indica Group]
MPTPHSPALGFQAATSPGQWNEVAASASPASRRIEKKPIIVSISHRDRVAESSSATSPTVVMASSPEKKDPPSCGSRDSQPIPCTDDPPLSESPTTDLGCHDPRDEDADHPAPPMGKDSDDVFASANSHNMLIGDIDEDSDDDGYADEETTCPGQNFTKEQAKEIIRKWLETYDKRNSEFMVACEEFQKQGGDETSASCPVFPLKPLPETTDFCTTKSLCYHREYKTNDTSETASTIGWLEPKEMLQIFSLRLSSSMSYPISVYGIFAVRDYLDPLRNYVFNRTRDDPVIVEQDSFTLPLCSPCRGMYVVEYALFEVDLWVKMEGGVSNDKQLLSAYVEIFARGVFNKEIRGRILSDHCYLDIHYMYLSQSIEAVIQVSTEIDSNDPRHVRFTAFCSGFDREILLFNGKFCKDKSFQHIVAMKSKGKLVVHLEFEGSLFCWTFNNAASTIGWREPKEMLQIFSKKLSSSMSYPISVYGIFAVRDYLDPLRNYVFNRTRDDPVIVEQCYILV